MACKKAIDVDSQGRRHTHYCKNRWCPTCNSIRTAVLICAYMHSLQQLNDPQFVTLTLPTCLADELPTQIKRMQKAWTQIRQSRTWRKLSPSGIKKEECTLRPEERYHYHYHVVIDGLDKANYLVAEWLRLFPEADAQAQKILKINNIDTFPLELFKYFTKLFAKRGKDGTSHIESRDLDWQRLDVIFCAIRGRRTFQSFGNCKKADIDEEQAFEELESLANDQPESRWVYDPAVGNWIDEFTGEIYSDFKPAGGLLKTLNDLINDGEDPPPWSDKDKAIVGLKRGQIN